MNRKNEKFKTSIPGALCFLRQVKYGLRRETLMLKSNFDSMDGKFVKCCIAV